MGITKAPGPRYVKELPGGTNVWEFNAQKTTIFCKACIYDVDYSASNVKYQLKSHYESGGHLHKVELRKNSNYSQHRWKVRMHLKKTLSKHWCYLENQFLGRMRTF